MKCFTVFLISCTHTHTHTHTKGECSWTVAHIIRVVWWKTSLLKLLIASVVCNHDLDHLFYQYKRNESVKGMQQKSAFAILETLQFTLFSWITNFLLYLMVFASSQHNYTVAGQGFSSPGEKIFGFFFVSFSFPSNISGVQPFWVRLLRMWLFFFNPNIEVVAIHLCGWCLLGLFLLPAFNF